MPPSRRRPVGWPSPSACSRATGPPRRSTSAGRWQWRDAVATPTSNSSPLPTWVPASCTPTGPRKAWFCSTRLWRPSPATTSTTSRRSRRSSASSSRRASTSTTWPGPTAAIHLARGETALARHVLERALDQMDPASTGTAPLLELLGDVHLAAGDVDAAVAVADRLATCAAAHRSDYLAATAALARG